MKEHEHATKNKSDTKPVHAITVIVVKESMSQCPMMKGMKGMKGMDEKSGDAQKEQK